jgi:hypothetical protein
MPSDVKRTWWNYFRSSQIDPEQPFASTRKTIPDMLAGEEGSLQFADSRVHQRAEHLDTRGGQVGA